MTRFIALLAVATGCGRILFDQHDTDASVDSIADRPNVVFVTKQGMPGSFGTTADSICTTDAAAAGLQGTFVAWISTSTSDAIDRLAGSRGWVRPDGAPFADTISAALTSATMFNAIVVAADRSLVPFDGNEYAWTGTAANGKAAATCGDWTGSGNGTFGDISANSPDFTSVGPLACTSAAHLYCFEIGHVAPVTPTPPVSGHRIAFVAGHRTVPGLAGIDLVCQTEATNAGLPGMYLGVAATTTTTIASRFSLDARPIRRVDGTVVANDGASFFAGADLVSFVNQKADGTYLSVFGAWFFSGATSPITVGTDNTTCNNWNDFSGGVDGTIGHAGDLDPAPFWGSVTSNSCNSTAFGQLCLEQ